MGKAKNEKRRNGIDQIIRLKAEIFDLANKQGKLQTEYGELEKKKQEMGAELLALEAKPPSEKEKG